MPKAEQVKTPAQIANQLCCLEARINTLSIREVTASGPVTAEDEMIVSNNAAADVTLDLPPAADVPGKVFIFKKVDAGGFNLIIDPDGTETVDGSGTDTVALQWGTSTIVSDGSNWLTI